MHLELFERTLIEVDAQQLKIDLETLKRVCKYSRTRKQKLDIELFYTIRHRMAMS